ncbi:MAG TPA: thiamine pyrophosphate-dependent enzyme, partial [Stellaceae bacterium]|nr:thiamine pyrophosphate-dependent enzyme [Stellaceae bacterium]
AYGGNPTEQSRELWTFNKTNFAAIAETIGAIGLRVEKAQDFAAAFTRALSADRPVILDVATDIDIAAPLAVS